MSRTVPPPAQRGAALLVALALLFMMSVLGISAMREATLGGQLAGNTLQKELTFQAAESATDAVLAESGTLEARICNYTVLELMRPELDDAPTQRTRAEVQYGGRAHLVGFSLSDSITARRFVVTGESSLPAVSTSTRIAQGIVLVGASDPDGGC